MEVVLKMLFLSLSNADIEFIELKKLTWRFYTTVKALSTINWVELINKREFTKAALDRNSKIIIIYISVLKAIKGLAIHFSQTTQITTL